MSCASIDLKSYLLGEADRREKSLCQEHVAQCVSCREELERLSGTHAALLALPEEPIPQRIAFVSDKVFQPRWWQTIWRSGPAMGFASAMLIAAAIVAHGAMTPAPVATPVARVDAAQIQREVDRRVQLAVKEAVAGMEERASARSTQMLAAAEKKFDRERRAELVAARETIRLYQQQMGRMMVAANYDRSAQQ